MNFNIKNGENSVLFFKKVLFVSEDKEIKSV